MMNDTTNKFQSPSYRGCLCIVTGGWWRSGSSVRCFNPLPIGAVSASVRVRWHGKGRGPAVSIPFLSGLSLHRPAAPVDCTRAAGEFQSPSYRGCLCIYGGHPRAKRGQLHTVSIPFLSGLSLHLRRLGPMSSRATRSFQSPSYRGCLCIPGCGKPAVTRRAWFQSPSYRGCLCIDTKCAELSSCGFSRFQSPSYRGCLCIPTGRLWSTPWAGPWSFNPLPIGAVSASVSPGSRRDHGDGQEFQSPSYRGCLCIEDVASHDDLPA